MLQSASLYVVFYGQCQLHFSEQFFHASRQHASAGSAARQGQVLSLSIKPKVHTKAYGSSQASTGSAEAFPSIESQTANLQTYTQNRQSSVSVQAQSSHCFSQRSLDLHKAKDLGPGADTGPALRTSRLACFFLLEKMKLTSAIRGHWPLLLQVATLPPNILPAACSTTGNAWALPVPIQTSEYLVYQSLPIHGH